jgi:CRP-like cAMP-binding protein
LDVFKKPFELRTKVENIYSRQVLEKVPFFQKSYNDMIHGSEDTEINPRSFQEYLMDCSKYIKLQSFKTGEVIFHKGDVGNKVYIILTGTVAVFVPKSFEESEQEFSQQVGVLKKLKESPGFKKSSRLEALKKIKQDWPKTTYTNLKNSVKFDRYLALLIIQKDLFPHINRDDYLLLGIGRIHLYYRQGVFEFKKICEMKENAIFGELALIRNAKRSATIVAKTDLTLLTLSKDDFSQIFASTLKSEGEKNEFFEILLGKHLARPAVIEIQNIFNEKRFGRDAEIFKQGGKIKNIYFVKTGDIILYKELSRGLNCADKKRFDSPELKNLFKQRVSNEEIVGQSSVTGIVSRFMLLGEDDFFDKKMLHSYSAIAQSSPTVVYWAPSEELNRKINKYSGNLRDWIKAAAKVKSQYMEAQSLRAENFGKIEDIDPKQDIIDKGGLVETPITGGVSNRLEKMMHCDKIFLANEIIDRKFFDNHPCFDKRNFVSIGWHPNVAANPVNMVDYERPVADTAHSRSAQM